MRNECNLGESPAERNLPRARIYDALLAEPVCQAAMARWLGRHAQGRTQSPPVPGSELGLAKEGVRWWAIPPGSARSPRFGVTLLRGPFLSAVLKRPSLSIRIWPRQSSSPSTESGPRFKLPTFSGKRSLSAV